MADYEIEIQLFGANISDVVPPWSAGLSFYFTSFIQIVANIGALNYRVMNFWYKRSGELTDIQEIMEPAFSFSICLNMPNENHNLMFDFSINRGDGIR